MPNFKLVRQVKHLKIICPVIRISRQVSYLGRLRFVEKTVYPLTVRCGLFYRFFYCGGGRLVVLRGRDPVAGLDEDLKVIRGGVVVGSLATHSELINPLIVF